MARTSKRLGRGISSLISAELTHPPSAAPAVAEPEGNAEPGAPEPSRREPSPLRGLGDGPLPGVHRLLTVSVERVRRNPRQPRRHFDEEAIGRLAKSLERSGALQPIVVRPADTGYELVAGERRLRAARVAGLTEIPAIVRAVSDGQLLELALVENIHREDLNPVERARGYRQLEEERGLTHEVIGEMMGEDRATVANYIRLLGLEDDVLALLAEGAISVGHGKAILGVASMQGQSSLAAQVVKEGWSVRRTETEASSLRDGSRSEKVTGKQKRAAVSEMEAVLTQALGLRVAITEGRKKHSGRIAIDYYCLDDFEGVARLLGADVEGI